MEFDTWRNFYESDLQAVYAVMVVPALFLAYLIASGRARGASSEATDSRFVRRYALFFTVETLLDPLATGPLTSFFSLGSAAASAVMLLFVLLGDLRVFLLLFYLATPQRGFPRALRTAAAWTLVVPVFAWTANAVLEHFAPELSGQRLWLIYEVSFLAMALTLRQRVIPARCEDPRDARLLRSLCSYVAVYYALWAGSDLLILYGGIDAGWLLRALPNQLYYAFWVPVVYFSFFSRR